MQSSIAMRGNETGSVKRATTIPPEDVTVAIFCALSIESVAVRYSLDERYESYPSIPGQHDYVYNYGRIGSHKVVLARPHQTGPVKAAQCAATVAQAFPNVRFALMIGIGGGIPSPKVDIRLGDVAVSIPKDGHPGVIQYDYGKYEAGGTFVLKGSLDKPPGILVSADGALEEDEEMDESPLKAILEGITIKKGYSRPTTADVLFEASFQHVNQGEDCSGCQASNMKKIEKRKPRDEEIRVHRGLILSGGGVIKNPIDRGELRRSNDNGICYDMETAGIMDQIPCLVIRGICDYSDTHKNDDWHRYAAAVAAAYGKAILSKIHAGDLKHTRSMKRVLDIFERKMQEFGSAIKELKQHAENSKEGKKREVVLDWLQEVDWRHQLFKHLESREPGTCQWFLDSPEFTEWLNKPGSTLLCQGLPGAGKTVMASMVVDYLQSNICQEPAQGPQARLGLAFVFCNSQDRQRQKAVHILASLLMQLIEQLPLMPSSLWLFYKKNKGNPLSYLQINDLVQSLTTVSNEFTRVFLVIDALDENEEVAQLVSAIISVQQWTRLSFVATSRPERRIQNLFGEHSSLNISATEQDVQLYLNKRISRHKVVEDASGDFELGTKERLGKEISERIGKAANGIFLLARFHMESVLEMTSPNGILETVRSLPRGPDAYHEIYNKTVQRIDNQPLEYRLLAKRTLEWVTCAQRPLKVEEIREALAIKSASRYLDKLDLSSTDALIESCKGLILIDEGVVQFLHHTTREYFDSNFAVLSRLSLRGVSVEPFHNYDLQDMSARASAEWRVALACATYLLFDDFAFGAVTTEEQLSQRHARHRLYRYAAKYCWKHLLNCKASASEIMCSPIIHGLLHSRGQLEAASQALLEGSSLNLRFFYSDEAIEGFTNLHLIAYLGMEGLVPALLDSTSKDQQDSYGRTPLSYAAQKGHQAAALALTQAGAGVNIEDNQGATPLYFAADEGHVTMVQLLLVSGAETEIEFWGQTPIVYAAKRGQEDIVRCLLDGSKTCEAVNNMSIALQGACDIGHFGIAKDLLDHNADADGKDCNGDTPLIVASRRGKLDMVRFLLDRGASPEIRDLWHATPLSEALRRGHMKVARVLINATQSPAVAPLASLLRSDTYPNLDNVLSLVLDQHIAPRLQKSQLLLLLLFSAAIGHVRGVRQLLDQGAPVDGELDTRTCSLHLNPDTLELPEPDSDPYACRFESHLSTYKSRTSQFTCGRTALWEAVAGGHFEAAKLLLDRGANPNTKDHHDTGTTPLSMAGRGGCLELVGALLTAVPV